MIPPQVQSTLKARDIVKEAREPRERDMSSRRGEASPAFSWGMCLSVYVRGWVWVGARRFMRLQICQSTHVCVCVCAHTRTRVSWCLCGSSLCPFSPPCSVLPSHNSLFPGAPPVPSPNLVPGPLKTMPLSSFLFISSIFLDCQPKLPVPLRYPLILVNTGTQGKEKTSSELHSRSVEESR